MSVIFALLVFTFGNVSVHADPVVSHELNLAVTELTAAITSGLVMIEKHDQAPDQATLDWIGRSLATVNGVVRKAARRDPVAVNDFLTEKFKSAFAHGFASIKATTAIEYNLRRQFLDRIKDQVVTDRFADHLAEVERRWRPEAEARVMAYAQTAGFVGTLAIVVGLVARYFDALAEPAVWGGALVAGAGILAVVYKRLPLTRRFSESSNDVLKPVLDCANELLETDPKPASMTQLSAGRLSRSRPNQRFGRGIQRRPPRGDGIY